MSESNIDLMYTKVSSFSLQVWWVHVGRMMVQLSKKVVKTEVKVLLTTNEHVLKWKDVVNPPQTETKVGARC